MATYRTSFTGGATSGSGDRTLAFTPAVGDHLTAFVVTSGNTNSTPTASDTGTGGTWALVGCLAWNASADRISVFVRNALAVSATSHTLTIATGSNTAGQIVVVAYTGISKVGASSVRSSGGQANQAASSTPAPALNQAALTGNPTIVMVGSGDTTTTPPTNWTERQDTSQSTPTTAIEVATRDSGFTGTTITFGATQSTVYASYAIELDTSISGTASLTDALETPSAAGSVDVAGASTVTEASESTSTAGGVQVSGAATATETAEAVAGAGTIEDAGVNAAAAIAEASESTAAAAQVLAAGAASATEVAEAVSAAGTVGVVGSGALTDADSVAAGAAVQVSGAGSAAEATEAAGGAATIAASGTAAIVDGDAVTAGAAAQVSGSSSLGEALEGLSATGEVAESGVSGAASLVDALEVVSAESALHVRGTATVTEDSETIAASTSDQLIEVTGSSTAELVSVHVVTSELRVMTSTSATIRPSRTITEESQT